MPGFLRRPRRRRPTAPAPTSVRDPDVEAATAAIRALHWRGERARRAWLGSPTTPEQRIAAFEAEWARDSSRRW